jgi:hypothetical protein
MHRRARTRSKRAGCAIARHALLDKRDDGPTFEAPACAPKVGCAQPPHVVPHRRPGCDQTIRGLLQEIRVRIMTAVRIRWRQACAAASARVSEKRWCRSARRQARATRGAGHCVSGAEDRARFDDW